MIIGGIDVDDTLKKAETVLSSEKELSPAVRSLVELQVLLITLFDIKILRVVTEYQAEILEDGNGKQFVASFPEGVTKAVRYGRDLKAHTVYMSQYQLVPYKRIQEYFSDQIGIPVSEGSIYNFNQEAYGLLEPVEVKIKENLAGSDLVHADETGINIKC